MGNGADDYLNIDFPVNLRMLWQLKVKLNSGKMIIFIYINKHVRAYMKSLHTNIISLHSIFRPHLHNTTRVCWLKAFLCNASHFFFIHFIFCLSRVEDQSF